jgi:hypothetical protein
MPEEQESSLGYFLSRDCQQDPDEERDYNELPVDAELEEHLEMMEAI